MREQKEAMGNQFLWDGRLVAKVGSQWFSMVLTAFLIWEDEQNSSKAQLGGQTVLMLSLQLPLVLFTRFEMLAFNAPHRKGTA